MTRSSLAACAVLAVVLSSCSRQPRLEPMSPQDSAAVVGENLLHRAEADTFFRSNPDSPFLRDSSVRYDGIRWFPIDVRYRVHSILHRYRDPDTVVIMGTRGEERRELRYGYFEFTLPSGAEQAVRARLNVYKFTPYDAQRYARYPDYLGVWFTDSTSGHETYHVGRYLDVGEENPDPNAMYTLDFNMAYNPYCAYSSLYSCAIPRKEDRLPLGVRAGELAYHP